jgi:hypothetical protein
MGLDTNGVKFLLSCHKQGVVFEETLMIGRQILNLEFSELKENLQYFDYYIDDAQVENLLQEADGYAEPLLRMLGARHIDSIDYSGYEGANLLHDMNLPFPENLLNRYSLVLESGTLEHIFHFPQAIKNCMESVAVGGHLLIITPVNNIMGHGFYQFSPELFYRVISPYNGFEINRMRIFEYDPYQHWYHVEDPKNVKQRVELMNSAATYLLIQARRASLKPIFPYYPQQSDYVDTWEGNENYYTALAKDRDAMPRKEAGSAPVKQFAKMFIPEFILKIYRAIVFSNKNKFNPKFYRKVNFEE